MKKDIIIGILLSVVVYNMDLWENRTNLLPCLLVIMPFLIIMADFWLQDLKERRNEYEYKNNHSARLHRNV